MSFLDNLENNLKSLESREERDPREHVRRRVERERARAIAPWADKLKSSDFVKGLLDEAARRGQQERAKLHIAWLENTLRLELRSRRLELRPTPDGILAAFVQDGSELRSEPLDLASDPAGLVARWLE